jgi:hypothetical protein
MRQLVAFAIAIALLATVPAREAIATPSIDELHVINHLVFATPLKTFRKERTQAKRTHQWLVTATDGCSAPLIGSTGTSFNFRLACERHDFAYANYPLLRRRGHSSEWNSILRAKVDDQFQRDLQASCVHRQHSQRLRCDAWVIIFFHTVRIAAGP